MILKMKTNLEYWQSIYSSASVPTFPSQFAIFVHSWLGSESCNILEVGCGNGRDSIFLSNAGHNVVVTDQCVGAELKQIASTSGNLNYVEEDINNAICNFSLYLDSTKRTIVYSRFFQHAIDDVAEEKMMNLLNTKIPEDSTLFFEFRLLEDKDQYKVFGTDHYRRFQSDDDFVNLLSRTGYSCEYRCKGNGYARFGQEDPIVGRFVVTPSKSPSLRIVK